MGSPAEAEVKEGRAGAGAAAGVTRPPVQRQLRIPAQACRPGLGSQVPGGPAGRGLEGLRDLQLWGPGWGCASRACFLLCEEKP